MTAFDFFAVIYYFFLALSGRSIHEETIKDALLNEFADIKYNLLTKIETLTKSLGSYYTSLNIFNKSVFLESEEFQDLPKLVEELILVANDQGKYLKYELCKVILEGVKNPLQKLGSKVNGNQLDRIEIAAKTYIK
ncbi:MAG: hypothetical protein RCO49_09610 [Rickettsia endosymbiont of Argas persicus]